MYGIEAFRKGLLRSEETMRGRMARSPLTPKGIEFAVRINVVHAWIQDIDNFVQPGRPGYGVIGEATLRAAQGRLF